MVSGKGDTLALRPGYRGEDLLDCGIYVIDKIDISAPPSTVNIDGIATSVSKALRTKTAVALRRLRFPPSPVASRKNTV